MVSIKKKFDMNILSIFNSNQTIQSNATNTMSSTINIPTDITNQIWLIKNIIKFTTLPDKVEHKKNLSKVLNDIKSIRKLKKKVIDARMKMYYMNTYGTFDTQTPEEANKNTFVNVIITGAAESLILNNPMIWNLAFDQSDVQRLKDLFGLDIYWRYGEIYGRMYVKNTLHDLYIKENYWHYKDDNLLKHNYDDVEKYI